MPLTPATLLLVDAGDRRSPLGRGADTQELCLGARVQQGQLQGDLRGLGSIAFQPIG